MADPSRGEVWLLALDPVRGHEQAGTRPCLVVSVDPLNHGPAGLTVVLPITSKHKSNPLLVEVAAPEGGLRQKSFIKCYAIRSAAKERLVECWGAVSPATLEQVEDRLRLLLNL